MPSASPYDALLLVSFGGPDKPEDVLPFLENVTRGRGIPQDRLHEVAEHYALFGGRSPINDQNRQLRAAVSADLAQAGLDLPVYWGNRNWHPFLADTVQEMAAAGVRRAACFVTSAYPSYAGCRQYRENLFDAWAAVDGAPRLDRLRHYHDHPGFVGPFVAATVAALDRIEQPLRSAARLAFVTHSIPVAMDQASGRIPGGAGGAYVRQHRAVAAEVARRVAETTGIERSHDLVFCSRSGPPQVPWLEPDVNDHLRSLAGQGHAVVLVPIGFVSDHLEVAYDLDTEAAATAGELGLTLERAATPGTHPAFVALVRDLLLERAARERDELPPVAGPTGWDVCPAGCCRNPREPERPALSGSDAVEVAG